MFAGEMWGCVCGRAFPVPNIIDLCVLRLQIGCSENLGKM